ncbi:hypothetical protein ACLMAJ_15970 [Nocardia sp. KC 131]|uniref:hypothetical protein n=1 Tax=Nocardia arseniciresistens TaxID=3392119 RepID=UPI00398E5F81
MDCAPYIHEAVLPTGIVSSRGDGNASVIAVDLEQLDVRLTLQQADKLGIWRATTDSPSAQPTAVCDLATIGVALMTAALEYVNAVVELVLFHRPTDDSTAHPILGCSSPDFPVPAPRSTELLIRRFFGW